MGRGEVPLGARPVSNTDDAAARGAELSFVVENRAHHFGGSSYLRPLEFTGPPDSVPLRTAAALQMVVTVAFTAGLTTAEIRDVVEMGIATAIAADPADVPAGTGEAVAQILEALRAMNVDVPAGSDIYPWPRQVGERRERN